MISNVRVGFLFVYERWGATGFCPTVPYRFWAEALLRSGQNRLSLPKTLSAHTNALIGKLIADRDQLEAAESKIGKCK